jgi:RNA polymerase sigma factor (sigma-70 family)
MTKEEVYALVEQHYRSNSATLFKMYKNDDIVHEAYTRALQYWESFNIEQDIDKWFHQIIRNCVVDYLVKERMHGMVDAEFAGDEMTHEDAFSKMMMDDVEKLIQKRKPEDQTILRLSIFYQYRPREIANLVPQNRGYISTLVYRFKEEARKELL